MDLTANLELDLIWRYVDQLPGIQIPAYNTLDVRLGCQLTSAMDLALVGRNLLDADHPQFGFDNYAGNVATNVQREFYGVLSWRY